MKNIQKKQIQMLKHIEVLGVRIYMHLRCKFTVATSAITAQRALRSEMYENVVQI
jgi:hypothetical protein